MIYQWLDVCRLSLLILLIIHYTLSKSLESTDQLQIITTNGNLVKGMDKALDNMNAVSSPVQPLGNSPLNLELPGLLQEALAEADEASWSVEPRHQISTSRHIRQVTSQPSTSLAGAGYSSDSEQVVSQKCFNSTISYTSAEHSVVHLDAPVSYSDLQSTLGVSGSIGGGIPGSIGNLLPIPFLAKMFSAHAKASYLKSVEEKSTTMSLNYYYFASKNVGLNLAGHGEEALTVAGKSFYKGGMNPHFGIICGDHYIKSYRQGALLAMALIIKFSSSNVKKEFELKAKVSFFGNIFSAAGSIQNFVAENTISGSVTIQAFQMGGEPSQLAKVLNKDNTGQFYALTCSLTTMSNCRMAVSGLLDYATNQFSTQFSFQNNRGLTYLDFAVNPVRYLNITSVSLVTPKIQQCRHELSRILIENENYLETMNLFFNQGYPAEIEAAFKIKCGSTFSKANSNVAILSQAHGGINDCYSFPDQCDNVKARITSQLQTITNEELRFLQAIKNWNVLLVQIIPISYGLHQTNLNNTIWIAMARNAIETLNNGPFFLGVLNFVKLPTIEIPTVLDGYCFQNGYTEPQTISTHCKHRLHTRMIHAENNMLCCRSTNDDVRWSEWLDTRNVPMMIIIHY